MLEQAAESPQDRPERHRLRGFAGQALAQAERHRDGERHAAQDGDEKGRAPPAERREQSADHRRDGRHHAHDGGHAGQFPPGPRTLVEIPHDGAGQHDRPRSAERLKKPRADQRVDVGRQGATEACQREQREPEEQHRLSPDPVRNRPVEKLPDGEPEQKNRQRQLRLPGTRRQILRDRRQRRQIHVGGERAQSGEKREDDCQSERVALEHGHGLNAGVRLGSTAWTGDVGYPSAARSCAHPDRSRPMGSRG